MIELLVFILVFNFVTPLLFSSTVDYNVTFPNSLLYRYPHDDPPIIIFGFHFREALSRWQNPSPSNCEKSSFLIVDPWNNGLGSYLHIAALGLQEAVCQGRIFLFKGTPIWKPYNSSSLFDYNSYFLPVSSCHPSNTSNITTMPPTQHQCFGKHKQNRFNNFIQTMMPNHKIPHNVDDQYWRAQFIRYLLRPTHFLKHEITLFLQQQAHFNLSRPYISIHVRYGDKSREARPVPLPRYLDAYYNAWQNAKEKQNEMKEKSLFDSFDSFSQTHSFDHLTSLFSLSNQR
jgi:hypothetical protein